MPIVAALLLLGTSRLGAVLFYSTDDPAYNTQPPTGSLTNSGWQWQGLWGGVLGTAIAPHYFIAAEHVGGTVGSDVFIYRGVTYTTSAVFDDPETDLRIWRVCGTLPDYAPLYTDTNEVGRGLVVIGRGTLRGAAVTSTNLFQVHTNGWLWGAADGAIRWGENEVARIVDGDGVLGATGVGEVLAADFDAGAGPNECHLSVGDSSGAVFIQDGATWKLAGINFAVDGPYNTSGTGSGFNAAIFDESGLYRSNGGVWIPTPIAQPGSFYPTRISTRINWINGVLSLPILDEPTVQSASTPGGTYTDFSPAVVDDVAKTVTITQPAGTQFYRLRACTALHISSIRLENGNLVLTYQ